MQTGVSLSMNEGVMWRAMFMRLDLVISLCQSIYNYGRCVSSAKQTRFGGECLCDDFIRAPNVCDKHEKHGDMITMLKNINIDLNDLRIFSPLGVDTLVTMRIEIKVAKR